MPTLPRPVIYLSQASRAYPTAWKQIEAFAADNGRGLPSWPPWCYCPLAGAYAIVSGGAPNRVTPSHIPQVSALGALAAWRITQSIYRFDTTLADELVRTELDAPLPVDTLLHLPEWCVYIESPPSATFLRQSVSGYFVHLEADANTGRTELRFLVDFTNNESWHHLQPVVLHLSSGATLLSALHAASKEAANQAALAGLSLHSAQSANAPDILSPDIKAPLALTLYLCSQEPDIVGNAGSPQQYFRDRTKFKKTKKGLRRFPPNRPAVWEVGWSTGKRLRQYSSASETPSGSVRPHLRRAHWHHFWTGPKNSSDQRQLVVKWLPPILVKPDDTIPDHVTVRNVRPPSP